MADKIYTLDPKDGLKPWEEKPFSAESQIQELIAGHPELLAGEQIDPEDPLRWILIRREMPIEGWAVDHLLIDQHARPTLVEVKRGENPDNRRKVVGQMLDYAATASSVWSGDGMRAAFEEDATKRNADLLAVMRDLLKPETTNDLEDLVDEFWERAATNLEANRLRLLFVADDIPVELERVVNFLNEQTRDNIEVLAVEVKQFPGQSNQTQVLVSRVIGQSVKETQHGPPARRGKDVVLERCSPAARGALLSLTDAAETSGAKVRWARQGVSISKRCSLWGTRVFVARFRWWSENDHQPLELFVHRQEYRPFPQDLRDVLQRWIDKFNHDDFVEEHTKSPNTDEGWAVTEDNFAANENTITQRLVETLEEIEAL